METITQMPVVVAAIQYSLIYMLLGGGLGGAVVIYIVAKVLGRTRTRAGRHATSVNAFHGRSWPRAPGKNPAHTHFGNPLKNGRALCTLLPHDTSTFDIGSSKRGVNPCHSRQPLRPTLLTG